MRRLVFCTALLVLPVTVSAQTASQALAAKWNTICTTAVNGTLLYQRCDETLNSPDSNANFIAATGQHLEELPGQARIATRDQSGLPGAVRVDFGSMSGTLQELPGGKLSLDLDQSIAANWSLFLSADIGRIDRSRSLHEAAFSADTWSATAGVDWRPAEFWQVGAAYTFSQEKLDYRDSDGSAETQFNGVLLLASRELPQQWLVHGYAGYLQGEYTLHREINYRIARPVGVFNVQALARGVPEASRKLIGLALNRTWSRKSLSGYVEAGLDITQTRIDGFTEQGGLGLALVLPERSVNTRRGRLDATLDHTASFAWGIWQPSIGLGWRHEFDNARRRLTVNLAQDVMQNAVGFDTEDPDRSWGELSFSNAFTFTGGHSAFIEYRQRFAHDFLDEKIIALGWRMELK